MKKSALFALPLLVSCTTSWNTLHPNEEMFPFSDEEGQAVITRNGDNYLKEGIGYSYDESTRPAVAEELIRQRVDGRGTLLFIHQDNCSSCMAAHDDLTRFFLDSGVEVFSLHFTKTNTAEVMSIVDHFTANYPALKSALVIDRTPFMYLIRDDTHAVPVMFQDMRSSLQNMEDFFKNLLNLPLIYNFRTFDAFASFVENNDCLAYKDSDIDEEEPSYFYRNIYPKAIHKPFHIAHIETDHLSEDDAARFETYFGEDDTMLIRGSEVKEKASSSLTPLEAERIIESALA